VADRTVMLRIGANISGLQSQLKAAQASVQDFSKKSVSYIEKNGATIDSLSTSVGTVGAGLTALAATAVTRFAQFDKAMSAVAATGDDARGSLDALRKAAVDAGADTAFSAQEAAGAIEQLAKAGVSSADILGGGLSGALSLAAAGEIEVADAAEIAASAMTQFGLAGTDVGHVADLLAAGAGKAQGGVLDMGQALNQSGLIAAQVGLSIEETTGALSAMASAGLVGSDAGTSLKTSLIALSSPSAVAAKEMERLGISAYDAQGNFIGMEALAGQLQTQLGGLTDEQRNSALATIFGTDALRTANVLYKEGAAGIAEWTAAVDDQGYAAETAAAQTNNLIGDVERLGGSLDAVLIQSGSGSNDFLRGAVQSAEEFVDAIGRVPGPVLAVTSLIAGGGGLALLGVAGLSKLAVATIQTRTEMVELGLISEKTAGKVGKIGKAAGVLGAVAAAGGAAVLAMDALTDSSDKAATGVEQTISALRGVGGSDINTLFAGLGGDVDSLAEGLDLLSGPSLEKFGSVLNTIFAGGQLQDQVKDTAAQFENIGQALAGMVAAGDAEAAAEQFDQIAAAAEAQGISVEEVNRLMPAYAEALAAAKNAQAETTESTGGATEATAEYTDAIQENIDAQREAAGVVLSLRDAQSAAEAAYDDAAAAIDENGKTLDVTTEKGRANRSALDGIAESGWELVDSMRANGASQTDLQNTMSTTRERFIETARAAGATKAEARALADQLLLHPKNVHTDITADGGQARNEGKKTKDYLNSLSAAIQVAADTGSAYAQANAIQRYINGLNATITVRERHVSSGLPGSRSGGITRAGGGPIPMVQGAVAGKDSVPVLATPDEHMLSVADVKAAGGHAAVYAWRASLHGGVQHLATGGAVGEATRSVDSLSRRLRSARRTHASDATIDRLEQQLDDARSRLDRLRSEAVTLSRALRRGEVDVTGGLSSAYGVTDDLRSLAASGDLGRSRSRSVLTRAGQGESALKGLYSQADRLEKRLADARDRHEELIQVSRGVRTSITGAFSLSDIRGEFDPATGKRVVSASAAATAAKAYAGKAKQFAGVLDQLGKHSGSAAIVQEVAGYGVEAGLPLAQSLLSDLPSLRSLASAYNDIDQYGNLVGRAVARAVGGGEGVAEARQAALQASAQAAAIDKNIAKWGKMLGREMAGALGIKARAAGGSYNAGDLVLTGERGPELEFKTRPGYVLTAEATRRLATSSGTSSATSGAPTTYNDNSLSVTTTQQVSERTLLRFDRHRQLLKGRNS